MFTRVGVPKEVLTDQGTNFMSALLEEIYHALQIKRIHTTPYHPQTDGLVERFNGTLREAPQETTGFLPFELLHGHHVQGPLDVLREGWTETGNQEIPVAAHVVEMRDRLQEMMEWFRITWSKRR